MYCVKHQFIPVDNILHNLYSVVKMLNPYQKKHMKMNTSNFLHGKAENKPPILKVYEMLCENPHMKPSGRAKVCLCPFHEDRKPSFALYEDTNSYYCFTCGEKGDSFDLIEKLLGHDFATAKAWAQDNALI